MAQLKKLFIHASIEKLRAFCKHSTMHGFYYFSEKRHPVVYVTWFIIILASSTLCAFLSNMIWLKYNMDPTFTVVQTTHYSTTEIPFPAVTVCDSEQVYIPNTENVTNILRQRSYSDEQIKEFYKSFNEVMEINYEPPSYVRKMHKALHDIGYSYSVMLEMFSKPCDILLVSCGWRASTHNCSEMFRKTYTVSGYCCTFDMDYFMKNADPRTNFVPGVDTSEALDIAVDGQKVTFENKVTSSYVLLYVYDEKTSVTVMDSPASLTPGGFFDTNIYVWAIESSPDVIALPIGARKCYLQEEVTSQWTFYQECIAVYVLRRVVESCRCLPFKYTASMLKVEDYPKCAWDRMLCIYKYLDKVKSNIKDIVYENDCLQKCDFVQYTTEIGFIRYYRNAGVGIKPSSNISNVVVHYSGRNCIKYKREVLYTWDQMLANLGGIFGLCLGGSIISIIEIIWFAIEFFVTVVLKGTNNSKTKPKEKAKLSLMTKNRPQVNIISNGNIGGRYKFMN